MSNGLLVGLTEAWKPDTTKAMIGQKTGLSSNSDSNLTFVNQAGFPGGKALQVDSLGGSIQIQTPASALVEALGITDFLLQFWAYLPEASIAGGFTCNFLIGENNNNGGDCGVLSPNPDFPQPIYGEIPNADGSYNSFNQSGDIFTADTAHMIAFGYTTGDSSFFLSIDGGTPIRWVNTWGVGALDPTNIVRWTLQAGSGYCQQGATNVWQGTAGVANAITQLSSLYTNKLQYSDFDSGGGGGGATASGMPIVTWRPIGAL